MKKRKIVLTSAFLFITLMGFVSLFSDMTHEGARSILGEYMNLVGANATTIGFVSGIGELCGYSLRLLSGIIADKTKKYWTLVIFGYVLQVLAIPMLCLVPENGFIFASILIILERVGKAIKKPAKNTLVSFAASEMGEGKGFAYQEFLDQLGAFLGPVILFIISVVKGTEHLYSTYRFCFLILGVPAIITITLLLIARFKYPNPESFEIEKKIEKKFVFKKTFFLYMIAISFFAFGFADFTLITLHVANENMIPASSLSLLYALAMVVDAFAALYFGSLFDKVGLKALMISTLFSSVFSIFIFLSHNISMVLIGVVLWGIGMGAEESIMKSAVSKLIPSDMRSTGFGIFETGFGIMWFLGSWAMGFLYDHNILIMVVVSVLAQFLSIFFYRLCIIKRE